MKILKYPMVQQYQQKIFKNAAFFEAVQSRLFTVVPFDLHDSLGHDGDGVGVALSDGEQGLGEVFQHLGPIL